jgi:hypothetical protein
MNRSNKFMHFLLPAIVAATLLLDILTAHAFGLVNISPISTAPQKSQLGYRRSSFREPLFAVKDRVWVPPSQNTEQHRGNVFSIRRPEDLLDFITEDDRVCVGESKLCLSSITCGIFDERY